MGEHVHRGSEPGPGVRPELVDFQDVLPVDTGAPMPLLWATIGSTTDAWQDGLWWSAELGDSSTRSIDGFWSSHRYADCFVSRFPYGTGALMVELPTGGDFLALENGGDLHTPDRGLYSHFGSTTATYRTNADANMGVCAIRVGNERADLTSGTVYWPEFPNPTPDAYCTGGGTCTPVRVPYHAEQAVDRGLMVATSALVADPYTQGVFYAGVLTSNCLPCDSTVSPQRPYILQRRSVLLTPTTDITTAWTWKRLPISELQQPWTGDMAWGAPEPGAEVDRVYLGAAVGGMWEGKIGW